MDGCLDAAVSRWLYQPPFDVVIHAFKFGRLEFLGSDLAAGLQLNLQESSQEIDVIVPIPLHWLRLRTRGFNQAEAIARPLALSLGRPLVKALRRRRSTKAQTLLTRGQRHQNLRLAFAQVRRQRHRIEGRRVLLVDDVVTTGATLESAARCLIELGAAAVIGATAGRTPGSRIETPTRERDGRLWRNSLTRKP